MANIIHNAYDMIFNDYFNDVNDPCMMLYTRYKCH